MLPERNRPLRKLLGKVRGAYRLILQLWEPIASATGFTSALYYLLFSSSFRREQKAVLKGKLHYRSAVYGSGGTPYLLRRNVHRIEKGIIMRPRRSVFARGYIEETVDAYAVASKTWKADPEKTEVLWATGVLNEYFSVVEADDGQIARAKRKFVQFRDAYVSENGPRPYPASEITCQPVSPKEFAELCRVRRSVRWYEDRPVPREAIDRAILAASSTPSACNRQPYHYLIFDEHALVQAVASVPLGTVGFSQNFPAIAILVGDLGAYFDERDRHVIYIDASLSAMAFMFALRTEGISTCSINWPDIGNKEKELRRLVHLPNHQRVIMLISFGYAAHEGLVPTSTKKSINCLRSYNNTSPVI